MKLSELIEAKHQAIVDAEQQKLAERKRQHEEAKQKAIATLKQELQPILEDEEDSEDWVVECVDPDAPFAVYEFTEDLRVILTLLRSSPRLYKVEITQVKYDDVVTIFRNNSYLEDLTKETLAKLVSKNLPHHS